MRTYNSAKNIVVGLLGQILTIALRFIGISALIATLGIEYRGISGLFSNILSILSLTELGVSISIIYSLYKPIADKDEQKILAIMLLYKRVYFLIGCAIGILGLILIPFLPYLMKGGTALANVTIYYLLSLFQTVSSYWFLAYRYTIVRADQKDYIINISNCIGSIISSAFQVVILFTLKSYILYASVGILEVIIRNLIIAHKADKLYPFLKNKSTAALSKEEKRTILKNTFAMSLYKISSVTMRSTNNIILSSLIGVIAVGYYSNYYTITSSVKHIIQIVMSSFTASVGNLYAKESAEKSEFIFRCLHLIAVWMYGFCGVCFFILIDPFITLWVGGDYLLSKFTVAVLIIDFVIDGWQTVSLAYKDACGLFWKGKLRPVFTAALNIGLSIILTIKFGIAGVILGTVLSRLLTTWWFEPKLIYNNAFHMSVRKYFTRYLSVTVLFAALLAITYAACLPFAAISLLNLMIKALICAVVPNLLILAVCWRSPEFKYILQQLTSLTKVLKKSV